MDMLRTIISYLQRSLNYFWLIVLAVYIAVLATQAFIRNYASQQDTEALAKELKLGRQERQRLESLTVYYQTDSYKEKELRRDLLLVRPDEKVYALPESGNPRSLEEEISRQSEFRVEADSKPKNDASTPNWRLWYNYLLHRS